MTITRKRPRSKDSGIMASRPASPALFTPEDRRKAKKISTRGTSTATTQAHESDLRFFWAWAKAVYGHETEPSYPVDEEMVMAFITQCLTGLKAQVIDLMLAEINAQLDADPQREGKRRGEIEIVPVHTVSTVSRRIASLSWRHRAQDLPNPCATDRIKQYLAEARRGAVRNGWRPKQKEALVWPLIEALLNRVRKVRL